MAWKDHIKALLRRVKKRWIVAACLLALIRILMLKPIWCEWYARHIYPILMNTFTALSSRVPFSVGDCLIYGSILFLISYSVRAIIRRKPFWSSLAFVGEYLIWTYIWFYLAWGLNYFRMDFYSRTGIRPTHFSSKAFNAFLHDYTEGLNASYLATGSKPQTTAPDLMATIAAKAFNLDTTANLGLAALPSRLQAKPMLFPRLMSGVGVTGYMGPFLAEFHISQQLLPSQYPFTYLHELSHLLGVSNEAEANFHAYLGCVASDEAAIRFSGYFSLLPYVANNARQVLEENEYRAWLEQIRPEILTLYDKKAAYWQALYYPIVGAAQEWIYDLFLRGNRISSGTANYSEVVAMLIATRENIKEKA